MDGPDSRAYQRAPTRGPQSDVYVYVQPTAERRIARLPARARSMGDLVPR